MARLPQPGQDSGTWGTILNEFLSMEHNASGTLKLRTDGTLDGFYEKPNTGIPLADLDATAQTRLAQAASAYQKPGGGIPKTDLATSLQTQLDAAVAASSLTLNVKTYGASGNGNSDDSQAFIDALAAANTAGGGTVYVPKGTYALTQTITVPSNCTLMGDGYNSVLKRKTGSSNNLVNIITISAATNVRITNVRIDSQKDDIIANYVSTAQDGSHMYITCNGVYVTGGTGTPSKNVTIDHCWIHDAYYGNIGADNVDGMVIDSNYLYNGRDNQINARCKYAVNGTCRNVTVSNNVVQGVGPIATQNQFSGIQFIRGDYITITGNVCRGLGNTATNEGNGIGLEGCRHVVIANNVCSYNLNQGIKVDRTTEGQPALWDAQTSYVPGDTASYQGRNFVAANYTKSTPPASATSDANWTYSASSPAQISINVTIQGNICANNNYYDSNAVLTTGIFVQYASGVLVEANNIYGNYQGITNGSSVRDLTIKGNNIYNNQRCGIALWHNVNSYGPFVIDGNYVARNKDRGIDSVVPATIINNIVHGNGWGGTAAGISAHITGTQTQTKPYYLIANNTCSDNTDNGILVPGSQSYTVPVEIRGNYAPASTIQPRLIADNGTAIRCVNNRAGSQTQQLWYFTHASSVWIDEKTQQIAKVTSNYSVGTDDQVVIVTPSANTTITLPAPNTTRPHGNPGRIITVSKAGASANTVTVATAGGTILAPTTVADNTCLRFVSDGTNWIAA